LTRERPVPPRQFIEHVTMTDLRRRSGGICALCSSYVRRKDASCDHILPLSLGGLHSRHNAWLVHLRCNVIKGRKLVHWVYDSPALMRSTEGLWG